MAFVGLCGDAISHDEWLGILAIENTGFLSEVIRSAGVP